MQWAFFFLLFFSQWSYLLKGHDALGRNLAAFEKLFSWDLHAVVDLLA